MRLWLTSPLALLIGLSLVTAALLCCFVGAGLPPTPGAELLLAMSWALMLVIWIDLDARRRGRLPCFDLGLLAAVWFPISVAWYCVWSRGWRRGLLLLLALFGLWIAPRLFAAFCWVGLQIVARR
ncbi:MAG TPA: hypothetical protein VFW33_11345 [Gemmataceae bacterium]|nr:hypothetical protein [Gemmataceae bacterium]